MMHNGPALLLALSADRTIQSGSNIFNRAFAIARVFELDNILQFAAAIQKITPSALVWSPFHLSAYFSIEFVVFA